MAMATASARLVAPILWKMTLSWEVGVDGKVRIGAQVGCALDVEWVLRRRSKHGDVVYRLDVKLPSEQPAAKGQVVSVRNADNGDAGADQGRERLPRHVHDRAIDCRIVGVEDNEMVSDVEVVVDDVTDRPRQPDDFCGKTRRERIL